MDTAVKNILVKAGKLAKSEDEKDVFALEDLKEKSNRQLGRYFHENEGEFDKVARAALNVAWADSVKTDIINQVIQTKTVDGTLREDTVEEDLRGLKARWQGSGGQIHSDPIHDSSFSFGPDEIVFAHDYHVKDLRNDFWGNYSKIVSHGRAKMDGVTVERLIALVQDGVNSGTNAAQYLTTAKASVTDAIVDALIDPISDRSSGNISILGSRSALAPLEKLGAEFSENLGERYFLTGQIGVYKGVRLVKTQNYEDASGNLVLPDDELWIVGENAGRLTWFGTEVRTQTQQLAAFHRRLEVARDAGMRLWGAERGRVGRIVWT